ncbi:MAG: hypothetical protein ACKOSS_09590 [Planctomycetia bacterium]
MHRAASYVLLVLVALMAFVPEALCPCASRARAEARPGPVAPATAVARGPACPHCVREAGAPAPRPACAGDVPAPVRERAPACPCCEVNGKGKLLLELGASVQPEPHSVLALAPEAAPAVACASLRAVACDACAGPAPPGARAPDDLRHGVVLRI